MAVATQTYCYYTTAELVIPTGTPMTEPKAENETKAEKAEAKTTKCSIQFKFYKSFCIYH